MKKVIKTILVLVLALAVGLSVVACGKIDDTAPEMKVKCKKIDGVYTVYDFVAGEEDTLDLDKALDADITNIRIKKGAFSGDSKIKKLIIPARVTSFDAGALEEMGALESLEIPFVGENANSDAFYAESKSAEDKAVDAARTIAYLFGTEEYDAGMAVTVKYDGTNSTTVYMPRTFREVIVNASEYYSIHMYAFSGAVNLTSVVLKGKIDAIGQNAFDGCKELKEIELPETVKVVYENAFLNCAKLDKLTVKGATITVKKGAFVGTKLANTALDGKVEKIDELRADIFGE